MTDGDIGAAPVTTIRNFPPMMFCKGKQKDSVITSTMAAALNSTACKRHSNLIKQTCVDMFESQHILEFS